MLPQDCREGLVLFALLYRIRRRRLESAYFDEVIHRVYGVTRAASTVTTLIYTLVLSANSIGYTQTNIS